MKHVETTRGLQVAPAQRVRSMLAVPSDLWLSGADQDAAPWLVERHVVLPGGALLVLAPEGVGAPGEVLSLEMTDVTSVPQPDRVRGHLRLRGTLAPYDGPRSQGVLDHLRGTVLDDDTAGPGEPALAVFTPVLVELARHGLGPWEPVALEDYRRAAPEPFVAQEHRWLPHLQRDHTATLRALAERVHGALAEGVDVRALGLDRFGLTLRLYSGTARLDLRVPFASEVGCGCDVREALGALLDREGA